jgi:copper resistance protein C
MKPSASLGLIVMLIVGLPAMVGAHAALVKSTPARGTTVVQPPQRVELIFSERLEPAYSTLAVVDAAGQQVDLRDGALSPADTRRVSVSLPPLVPGTYTVRFRVLSVDGHIVESEFQFTVGSRGAAR